MAGGMWCRLTGLRLREGRVCSARVELFGSRGSVHGGLFGSGLMHDSMTSREARLHEAYCAFLAVGNCALFLFTIFLFGTVE